VVATETATAGFGWLNAAALLSIPLLISLNGFFVAAEFALVAIRRTRVEEMINRGERRAKAIETALAHLDHSIAATQLGITLASIGLGMVSEPVLATLFEPLFRFLPANWLFVSTHALAGTVAFILVTFLHVIFGELMPKAVALQTTDRVALMVAGPLNLFARVTRPVIGLMNGTGNFLLRRLGYRPATGEEEVHSVEELALLIEDTEEAGLLDAEQAALVQNVFRLSNKRVRDIMVPRDKMMALDLRTPPDKVLELVRQGAHTRMPVYDGTPDNIVGVVNTKNLLYLFSLDQLIVIEDARDEVPFLDPDLRVAEALREFKRRRGRGSMAVVRDPTGQVLGLVTLEDVIEEIVGDIEDEHDAPDYMLKLKRMMTRRRRKL
jgi:putative hemolysin